MYDRRCFFIQHGKIFSLIAKNLINTPWFNDFNSKHIFLLLIEIVSMIKY